MYKAIIIIALISLYLIPVSAVVIIDQSGMAGTGLLTQSTGGELIGFSFEHNLSFTIGQVRVVFSARSGYNNTTPTNFQLYTINGTNYTPVTGSQVSSTIAFSGDNDEYTDFGTQSTLLDFTPNNITLNANTEYAILGRHNSGGGALGMISNKNNPYTDGRAMITIAGNLFFAHLMDSPFIINDIVPEPSMYLLLFGLLGLGGYRLYRRKQANNQAV
jgi:hypothetical protein